MTETITTDLSAVSADRQAQAGKKVGKKRELTGVVVSTKMQDTAVVEVTRYVKHAKYKKYMKRMKRYHADDKGNSVKVGDKVRIQECTPISKRKHFRVISS